MQHLIKFKGENSSGAYDLNLLCNLDKVYVMDNHRAALWCWLQIIDLTQKYNMLHIDAHHDTNDGKLCSSLENINKNFKLLSIEQYLALEYKDTNFESNSKVISWDNYIPIFHSLYGENCINHYNFFTHGLNTISKEIELMTTEYNIENAMGNIEKLLNDDCNTFKWIVNIDLDYFFEEGSDGFKRLFDNKSINNLIEIIANSLENRIAILTIALSPEQCGGWENAKSILSLFENSLGFKVPLSEINTH